MRQPEGMALDLERGILEAHLITQEHLSQFSRSGEGTRRPLRLFYSDLEVKIQEKKQEEIVLLVKFLLPKGSFATNVLDYVCLWEDKHFSGKELNQAEFE